MNDGEITRLAQPSMPRAEFLHLFRVDKATICDEESYEAVASSSLRLYFSVTGQRLSSGSRKGVE